MSDIGDARSRRCARAARSRAWAGRANGWSLNRSTIMLKSDEGISRGWLGDHDDSVVTDDLLADDWGGRRLSHPMDMSLSVTGWAIDPEHLSDIRFELVHSEMTGDCFGIKLEFRKNETDALLARHRDEGR